MLHHFLSSEQAAPESYGRRHVAAVPLSNFVISSAGKLGRAESATDPAPVEMIETTILLKPHSQWRHGMTKDLLVNELSKKLTAVPGYVPGFLQPIENRILMLSTGIRAQVGVKILGSDLDVLQQVVFDVERIVREVPGAVGVAPSRVLAKPYLEVIPDRFRIAQLGLSIREVLDYAETGLGGVNVTSTIQGRERFPIQRIQFQRRRVSWFYRPLWHGDSDWYCDGHLSEPGVGNKTASLRIGIQPCRFT